jgi:TolB-like protein
VMAQRNEGVTVDRRMLFRIGINLGDILIEGDDILGDGVNVAARLEGIAEPGGICISSSAYDQVRGKVAAEFADLGEQRLKNIDRPVRAFAVVLDRIGLVTQGDRAIPSWTAAPRLSIVVLPFADIGGGSDQDYFVDGVTESLTTDLSRIAGAFVIARHTAFTFKGKAVDVKKLGRDLNVRYVLEGSVQRGGNRLRVNVQLIDAETGNHLWAERFDKFVADLFDMQDEIVSRLANALDGQLIAAEARRAEHSLHPDATDLVLQGRAWLNKGLNPEYMAQARGFFDHALALDPSNIEAMVSLAEANMATGVSYATDDRTVYLEAAEKGLIKVLNMTPQHARAHVLLGRVLNATNRAVQGIAECEQGLALDRNQANAHAAIGLAKWYIGRGEETEAHVNEALRLSPRDTSAFRWLFWGGVAKLQGGANAEAVAWLRRSIESDRSYPLAHFFLATTLALLGELDQARAEAQAGLTLDPTFTIRRYRVDSPSNHPTFLAARQRFYEGMRLAGLPEG